MSKVLVIINNLAIGGAERVAVDDINALLDAGVDVVLVTLKHEGAQSFASQCRISKEKWIVIPFRTMHDMRAWRQICAVLRTEKPDLIVSHLWYANTIGRIAALCVGMQSRYLAVEQNVYDTIKTRRMFLYDYILQFFCKKVIAVSHAVKHSLLRHGVRESRIDVLYNAVDVSRYGSRTGRMQTRTTLGVSESDFAYICVGRLIPQKGMDVLLRAFAVVPQGKLIIVGQGPLLEELVTLRTELGLGDRVIFAGVYPAIAPLLAAADVFVLASRHEGWPLVLVEAMMSNLPIVTTNFEAAQEVFTHEKDALIVPRENSDVLAAAMNRVRMEADLRAYLQSNITTLRTQFTSDAHARAILAYITS